MRRMQPSPAIPTVFDVSPTQTLHIRGCAGEYVFHWCGAPYGPNNCTIDELKSFRDWVDSRIKALSRPATKVATVIALGDSKHLSSCGDVVTTNEDKWWAVTLTRAGAIVNRGTVDCPVHNIRREVPAEWPNLPPDFDFDAFEQAISAK